MFWPKDILDMKFHARFALITALVTLSAQAFLDARADDCGDMVKALPKVVGEMSLKETKCINVSAETAKAVNSFPQRAVEGDYQLTGKDDELMTIKLSDLRNDPQKLFIGGVAVSVQGFKDAEKALLVGAKSGAPQLVENYKQFRACSRVIGFVKADEGTLFLHVPEGGESKGGVEVYGAVYGTTIVEMYYPATDIADALKIFQQATAAMNFAYLK